MRAYTTICALATPPGEGGIATVRLSGPEAYPIAARVFFPANPRKAVADAPGYTALFGHYRLDGAELDETVALFFRAPHSYTGEDVVELSCHGGSYVSQTILRGLLQAGATRAARGRQAHARSAPASAHRPDHATPAAAIVASTVRPQKPD